MGVIIVRYLSVQGGGVLPEPNETPWSAPGFPRRAPRYWAPLLQPQPRRLTRFSCVSCWFGLQCHRVPLMSHSHSFSAPSRSLKLCCLNCVLVSHVCSAVLRSLPVPMRSTQAVWSCCESELRFALRVVVAHVLHDLLYFLSIKECRHKVCFVAGSWDCPNRCLSPVDNCLHPQPLCVHASTPNLTQSWRLTRPDTESVSSTPLTTCA